ncbi:MAG TPA: hypothetical protein VG276_27855 [Actinomycetes bacterium]|jgi:hypothetical protein|nr:hypothetical protein [Actinomycetes bacterium]
MAGQFWLGPPGALVQIRAPSALDPTLIRKGGAHELLAGGSVRDTLGYRRRFQFEWQNLLTTDELAQLENLYLLGGPLVFVDPSRRNLLTANQSTGTDALDTTEGFSAPFQGTVTSDTTQFKSGSRSLKWDTVTSLTVTNRGVYLPTTAGSTPDATWAAILPSTVYTFSSYVRANAAITMYAAIDWRTAAGAATGSTDFGSAVAVSTTDWSTRLTCANKTSPATAAYAVPSVLDSTAPGAIRLVFHDELQLEQTAAASAWAIGTGTPRVYFDSFSSTLERAWDADPRWNATAVLVEV